MKLAENIGNTVENNPWTSDPVWIRTQIQGFGSLPRSGNFYLLTMAEVCACGLLSEKQFTGWMLIP